MIFEYKMKGKIRRIKMARIEVIAFGDNQIIKLNY